MTTKILYTKPSITELEIRYASQAASNGWGNSCYEYINRFEDLFKNHLDVQYAIATSSCTGALHMGMAALGIGRGDEVIMADANWIATASPIIHLGAKPIFVDILPDTWCLDPKLVEEAITPRTKAIIAVHLYGNLCDMTRLLAIGDKYGIPVIEDAAEAIGSTYQGKKAGSLGRFGAFSFHGTKTLSTGEGGMFVTNDFDLYQKVLTLSNHGRVKGQVRQFWPECIGFKYKISNIQAAIGCAQVERASELIKRKREILNVYRLAFNHIPSLSMNPVQPGCDSGAWMPTIVFQAEHEFLKPKLQEKFINLDIDARVFFHPLSTLQMFAGVPTGKNALSISRRAMNLPSYHDINEKQLNTVIQAVHELFKSK